MVYPIRLSSMAQEQRCPDNRGSTVSLYVLSLSYSAKLELLFFSRSICAPLENHNFFVAL